MREKAWTSTGNTHCSPARYADAKENRDFRAFEVPRPVDPRSGRPVGSPVDCVPGSISIPNPAQRSASVCACGGWSWAQHSATRGRAIKPLGTGGNARPQWQTPGTRKRASQTPSWSAHTGPRSRRGAVAPERLPVPRPHAWSRALGRHRVAGVYGTACSRRCACR